jgi:hypothetical protein
MTRARQAVGARKLREEPPRWRPQQAGALLALLLLERQPPHAHAEAQPSTLAGAPQALLLLRAGCKRGGGASRVHAPRVRTPLQFVDIGGERGGDLRRAVRAATVRHHRA